MKNKKNQQRSKTSVIILILLGILVAGGVFYFLSRNPSNSTSDDNDPDDSSVQVEEDPNKGAVPNPDDHDPDNQDLSATLKTVSVIITYSGVEDGQVSVGGIVTDVVETDGTCTYAFTGPHSKTASYKSDPVRSASSTSCTGIDINQNLFNPGDWSVVLKYQSSKSKGESASASFQIP